jgi:hypothetical protein
MCILFCGHYHFKVGVFYDSIEFVTVGEHPTGISIIMCMCIRSWLTPCTNLFPAGDLA